MRNRQQSVFSTLLALSIALWPAKSWSDVAPFSLDKLSMTHCATEAGVLVLNYKDVETGSPYATDFDKREVSVAISNSRALILKKIGAEVTKRGISLHKTLLVSPPAPAQIKDRHMSPNPARSGNWKVFIENIQYAAQGSAPGFPIKCGTALQFNDFGDSAVAVSECFTYENKHRFLSTLTRVDLEALRCQEDRR